MAIYAVEICRIGYGFATLRIEADSPEEAKERALYKAGNYLFSEKSSEYEVDDVSEIGE